jgi:IclR family KDG regulon transcriptional repressor
MNNKKRTVQSIDRAFEILEALAEEPEGMYIIDLENKLKLNKSTIHRILQTLVKWGYVQKNPDTKCYRLGLKVVALSSSYLNSLQLKTESLPYMERLQNKTGLVIHLAIIDDRDVVYIEKIGSTNYLRLYSQIGKRAYIHSTGLGKSMLSQMDKNFVEYCLSKHGLVRVTDRTIQSRERFYKELEETRNRGYAIDDEENEKGVRCVAAPIFDYTGKVIAAVSITGYLDSFPIGKINFLGTEVMKCADSISARMGYRSDNHTQTRVLL